MFFNFIESAEDYVLDDKAEEIEDAMINIIEDDSNDIDNIADIDEDNNCPYSDEEDDYEDEDNYEDENDDEDYVDYIVSDD